MTTLSKHRRLWREKSFLLSLLTGIAILLVGVVCILSAREYLVLTSSSIGAKPDFFLDILPVMRLEDFLVWGVPVLLLFITSILFVYPERLPFSLKAIGLFLLIRSFFIVLTPLGVRPDQITSSAQGLFQSLAYGGHDFFFSGHVSFPLLFAFIFWEVLWVRSTMFLIAGFFGCAVLLAHTHYSIDVFAVPVIMPSIHRLALIIFKQDTVPILRVRHSRPLSLGLFRPALP
jgi:hypothetical protein